MCVNTRYVDFTRGTSSNIYIGGCILEDVLTTFDSFSVESLHVCIVLSGAVNTLGFVWKFLCAIYNFSFVHSAHEGFILKRSHSEKVCRYIND